MFLSSFSPHARTVSLPSGAFGFIRHLLHCCCTGPHRVCALLPLSLKSRSLCFLYSVRFVLGLIPVLLPSNALPVCFWRNTHLFFFNTPIADSCACVLGFQVRLSRTSSVKYPRLVLRTQRIEFEYGFEEQSEPLCYHKAPL
jgi:hypothetical protein